MVMSIDKLLETAKKLEQSIQQNTAKILDDKKKIEQNLKSKSKK
jgi:hypothetical protein